MYDIRTGNKVKQYSLGNDDEFIMTTGLTIGDCNYFDNDKLIND